RRHTRSYGDWSSDVCSSDLVAIATSNVSLLLVYGLVLMAGVASAFEGPARQALIPALVPRYMFSRAMTLNSTLQSLSSVSGPARSEERRVGKEGRARGGAER